MTFRAIFIWRSKSVLSFGLVGSDIGRSYHHRDCCEYVSQGVKPHLSAAADPRLLRTQPVDPLLRPALGGQSLLVDQPAVVHRAIVGAAWVILLAPGDEVGADRAADPAA